MEYAERFRLRQFLTDGIVRITDKDFPIHKIILASNSKYFEELFTNSADQEIYVMNFRASLSCEIFDLILAHIYNQPLPKLDWETYCQLTEEMLFLEIRDGHPERLLKLIKITPDRLYDYLRILRVFFPQKIPSDFVNYISKHLNYDYDLRQVDAPLIRRLLSSKSFVPRNLIRLYQLIKGLVDSGHDPDLYNLLNYKCFPLDIYLHFSQPFLKEHDIGTLPRLWNGDGDDLNVTLLVIESEKAMDNTGRIWDIKGMIEPDFQFCDIITLCDCVIDSEKNLIQYQLCFYF